MNYQEQLLKTIRKHYSKPVSLNDEIASILNISYDAAHRRISGKSKFSIEETAQLAAHYNISLDNLFVGSEKVIVEKTIEITNLSDMLQYFSKSAEQIRKLTDYPAAVLYYSAKDIPLFYFMDGTILSKFKAYVWLNLLNPDRQRVAFEQFIVDESFLEHTQKLKNIYENVEVREIWNDTTINSSLQQILYFYEAGLLNFKSARALCNDLKRILDVISNKCTNPKFSLYYNELILLNNNVMIDADGKQTLFVPYTLLGYFITDNAESCKNVSTFFNQQIQNSVPLSKSGIRDRNRFFNKAVRKIDYYMEKLDNQVDIMF